MKSRFRWFTPLFISALAVLAMAQFVLVMLGCNYLAELCANRFAAMQYFRGAAPFIAILSLAFPLGIWVALDAARAVIPATAYIRRQRAAVIVNRHNRWSAILLLDAVLLFALLLVYYGLALEIYRDKPILFPPRSAWPAEVLAATTEFHALTNKWRVAQACEIESFARRCYYHSKYDDDSRDGAPLFKRDVYLLLGQPDSDDGERWTYKVAQHLYDSDWLDVRFSLNKVIAIGMGSASGSRQVAPDEITEPPPKYKDSGW